MSVNSFVLIDKLVDEHPEMRQMCAKVHPCSVSTALEECCNFLDLSKREFIEAAADALTRSKAQIRRSGNALDQDEPVMLTLTGVIRAVTTLGGGVNKKPARSSHSPCPPGRGPGQPWSGPVLHPHRARHQAL
jgi:hypothetical protein